MTMAPPKTDEHVRSWAIDLVELTRAQTGDGRTVVGRIVPYDVEQEIPFEGIVEVFRMGCCRNILRDPQRLKFFVEHGHRIGELPIGRAETLREAKDGLHGEMRVARTAKGDEALELIDGGVLDQFSIGFRALKDKIGPPQANGMRLVERILIQPREASATWRGAYGKAASITGTRNDGGATPRLDAARAKLEALRAIV